MSHFSSSFLKLFKKKAPIIGMIHLPALLGYKQSPGIDAVIKHALKDLKTLEAGGVDGVMVENEYDRPHQVVVGPEIVAAMTTITQAVVRSAKKTVVGVEILLNDPRASLAVAKATNASFIRTDYFVDRMSRKEYGGEMKINPKEIIAYRKKIGAESVLILTDIQVKYATMLEEKSISQSTKQAIKEKADAVIVTGKLTGQSPVVSDLEAAKRVSEKHPILIGSGLTPENAQALLQVADGAIVGTGIKTGEYVDLRKVKLLMREVTKFR